ncbi:MAG: 2-C-methyl-D-erythritol 2,4-cyclodiphosphate synthase [Desulfobacterales bacterium]
MFRVGMGFDMHRLVEGRPLILGGVPLPWNRGLEGHSDADVLLHAICDALLGAAGMGDIGMHFPDSDPELAGISSLVLLRRVVDLIRGEGYQIVNVDATVIAQAPKIGPYRESMKIGIAAAAGIDADRVNIKATTTENLDATGEGKGIAANCVALIEKETGVASG